MVVNLQPLVVNRQASNFAKVAEGLQVFSPPVTHLQIDVSLGDLKVCSVYCQVAFSMSVCAFVEVTEIFFASLFGTVCAQHPLTCVIGGWFVGGKLVF